MSDCQGCGAPIDCPNEDDFAYTLTGDPTFPYALLCPPGQTCPGNGIPGPITLMCCDHAITRYVTNTTTAAQISDLMASMLTECQQYQAECNDPPPPNGVINPTTFYFNTPQTCTVPCP